MSFCVESLTPPAQLRAAHGVLRHASLVVMADAHEAAQNIIDAAEDQATRILMQAEAEAQSRVQSAEQQTFEQAQQLLKLLRGAHAAFLEQAQDIVIDLAQALFDRLVIDMTARERLEIMLKRILIEAPPRLHNPMLRVHPDDMDTLPAVDWDVKPDAKLMPGSCRLEASSGEWCVDFNAAVASLKLALHKAVQPADDDQDEPIDNDQDQPLDS